MYSSCFSTTRDWNNLNPEIRNSGNINIFKRRTKVVPEKVPYYFGWRDIKLVFFIADIEMCAAR